MLAIAAGADYIAPYFNRMESLDIDTCATIKSLAKFVDRHGANCKIMAAGFKNVAQFSAAFEAEGGGLSLEASGGEEHEEHEERVHEGMGLHTRSTEEHGGARS